MGRSRNKPEERGVTDMFRGKKVGSRILGLLGMGLGAGCIPHWAWAAGEKAGNLVVVTDTRRLSGIMKYFANLYNTNTLLFAVWAVVLTVLFGAILGFLMDWLMAKTGIDLKSRKIIEH